MLFKANHALEKVADYTKLPDGTWDATVPFECKTSTLGTEGGVVTVPTGPGSGIEIDAAFIRKHKVVKA